MIGFGTGFLLVGFQSDFAVFRRCCFCGSKMVFKELHGLTANELRVETEANKYQGEVYQG